MKRTAIYARVSTDTQTTENQIQELKAHAQRQGWTVTKIYQDQGVSGAANRKKRPEFEQMLRDALAKKFDLIAAWSIDRLGRSMQDLGAFLADVHSKNIDLYLHQQHLDTTT